MTTIEQIFWNQVFAAAIAAGKNTTSASIMATEAVKYSRGANRELSRD